VLVDVSTTVGDASVIVEVSAVEVVVVVVCTVNVVLTVVGGPFLIFTNVDVTLAVDAAVFVLVTVTVPDCLCPRCLHQASKD